MYSKIVQKLKEAKKTGDTTNIKEALLFFCNSIKETVENNEYKNLSEFIEDVDMVFKTQKNIVSQTESDRTIQSTGLLNQLLEMIENSDYEKITDSIHDMVTGLYAEFSSGTKDLSVQKEALLSSVDKLLSLIF